MFTKILSQYLYKSYHWSPLKKEGLIHAFDNTITSLKEKFISKTYEMKQALSNKKRRIKQKLVEPEIAEKVYSPGCKISVGLMSRIILHPYQTVLVNLLGNSEKFPTFMSAVNVVKKNPFVGLSTLIRGYLLGNGTMFVLSDNLKKSTSASQSRIYAAAMTSFITTPFEVYKILQQAGKNPPKMTEWLKASRFSTIYRGNSLAMLRSGANWCIGLPIGEKFAKISREIYGDNWVSSIAASALGITLGNLVFGAPLYNLQLRSVMNDQSVIKTLKQLDVKENKGEITKKRFYEIFKNSSKLWRGTIEFLPITIFSAIILSLAERSGKKIVEHCEKESKKM